MLRSNLVFIPIRSNSRSTTWTTRVQLAFGATASVTCPTVKRPSYMTDYFADCLCIFPGSGETSENHWIPLLAQDPKMAENHVRVIVCLFPSCIPLVPLCAVLSIVSVVDSIKYIGEHCYLICVNVVSSIIGTCVHSCFRSNLIWPRVTQSQPLAEESYFCFERKVLPFERKSSA